MHDDIDLEMIKTEPDYEKVEVLPSSPYYEKDHPVWLVLKHDPKTASLRAFKNYKHRKEVPLSAIYRITPSEKETEFYERVSKSHFKKALELYRQDPLINVNWYNKSMPLVKYLDGDHLKKSIKTLKFLLDLGADINQTNFKSNHDLNWPPLWSFAHDGDDAICELLIANGANAQFIPNPPQKGKAPFNVLNLALSCKSYTTLGVLLALGVHEASHNSLAVQMEEDQLNVYSFDPNQMYQSYFLCQHHLTFSLMQTCLMGLDRDTPNKALEALVEWAEKQGDRLEDANPYGHNVLEMAEYLRKENIIAYCQKRQAAQEASLLQSQTHSVMAIRKSPRI